MKKITAALLSLLVMVTFCGCLGMGGSREDDDVDPSTLDLNVDPATKAELTIAIGSEPAEEKMIDAAIAGFRETYKNITFEKVKLSGYDQTLMGDISAGLVYDVLWVADEIVTTFAEEHIVAKLDPYIEASGFDTSLYYPSMIRMGQAYHNGSQYFLPRDYNKIVVYVNKAMFRELNVELPKDNWTWEEYLQTCEALQSAIGKSSNKNRYAMEAELAWMIQLHGITSSYGGTFLNSKGEPVLDAEYQAGLQSMQDLVKKGYVKYRSAAQETDFIGGRVAMRWQVRPALSTYYAVLGDDLDVTAFPSIGNRPKVGTGTTGYGIGNNSTKKVLAWKFIEYMMSPEGQKKMSDSGSIVPSLVSLAEDKQAGWRTVYPQMNHDAFIYNGTGDVLPDYYDGINDVMATAYRSAVYDMVDNVLNGKSVASSVATCKLAIREFIKNS